MMGTLLTYKLSTHPVEPHGQEPVAPAVRRNPPKLQSSFAKASEDTRIPPRSGDRGFLRRRVRKSVAEVFHPSVFFHHERPPAFGREALSHSQSETGKKTLHLFGLILTES